MVKNIFNKRAKAFQKSFKKFKMSSKKSKYAKYYKLIPPVVTIALALYLARSLFIAALVNGRPVTRFSVISELEKQGGSSTLDNLISKNLIFQEARKRGINISELEIDSEIENIRLQVSQGGKTLEEVLESEGQSMKTLRENIRLQKLAELLLSEKIQITEEEIRQYFDENSELMGENAVFENVKGDIENFLKNQKLNQEYQSWIKSLKESANIKYFVNYNK